MIFQAKNLSVLFSGLLALDRVSFEVAENSITGLIGPNGAGKSTFFNVVSRLYHPYAGDILFKGESLLSCSPHEIARRGICRTFQTPEIFKRLTVFENLLVGAHLFFRCGLAGCAARLPRARREERELREIAAGLLRSLGIERYRDQPADNIPLVFQRHLEIGRALLARPSLLLLDEPTAGMTAEEKEHVIRFIREIRDRKGITVIIIEHDIKLIRKLCNHMVVLNFGEKIADGDPDEVSRNEAVIKAYLGEV